MIEGGLPFEGAFTGLVENASRQFASHSLLSPKALVSAQRDLLHLLTGICARPLLAAFTVFRDSHSGAVYQKFVARLRQGGIEAFFREFPVLSRLAAMCVQDWTDAIGELLSRLACDRADLVRAFGEGATGTVADIESALSDRHRGRSVMAITFESGLKLVYKPRDMALERWYFEFLDWLNRHGSPVDYRGVKVAAKPGYGWVEWVAHEPCRNASDARGYFIRAGALQCLLYVLHATDAHMGNIIAAGPQPVLVDAECLAQPRWRLAADADPDGADSDVQGIDDLLRAGLLPQPKLLRGEEVDLSALSGDPGQPTNFRVPVWERLNTDAMSLHMVRSSLLPQKNAPFWNGERVTLSAHAGEFTRGFQDMYRWLAGRVPALLAADGPLEALFSCHARVLLDHTRRYLSLLNRSLHPRYLRDDARRVAMLREQLSGERPGPILEAETKALASLDVPYFMVPVRGVSLLSDQRLLIPNYFAAPGEEVVRSRLANLSESNLESQIGRVRVILAMSCLKM